MSTFTKEFCDTNCACDSVWFDAVSQNAHWLGGMLFVVGLVILCGKWITWWSVLVFTIYVVVKECAIDPATEPAGWDGRSGGCDGEDIGFYMTGVVLGVIVVYFSQLPGTTWPWPPRCRPCCPPREKETDICCGFIDLDPDSEEEEDDPIMQRQVRERAELLYQRRKELEAMGLAHE